MGGDSPFGKVQIQLNGRRLNRPDMASVNWFQIPLSQVERIEIVRGAGSVLYGDSAVAGVINIITRKGEGRPVFHTSAVAGSYGLHDEKAAVSGSGKEVVLCRQRRELFLSRVSEPVDGLFSGRRSGSGL